MAALAAINGCAQVTVSATDICGATPTPGNPLCLDGGGKVPSGTLPTGVVTGSGTDNYYPLWATGGTTLTLGRLRENGSFLVREYLGNSIFDASTFSTNSGTRGGIRTLKSHSDTVGVLSATLDGELLGLYQALGVRADSASYAQAGRMDWLQDGASGTGVPGRWQLHLFTAAGTDQTTIDCRADNTCAFGGQVSTPSLKLTPASGSFILATPSTVTPYTATVPSAVCASGQSWGFVDGAGTMGCVNVLAADGATGTGCTTVNTASGKVTTCDTTARVAANAAITGATKTKITYDDKGLVTAGADATASDVGAAPQSVFSVSIPTVVGNSVTFASVTNSNFASPLRIEYVVHDGGFAQSKLYDVATSYHGTLGAWQAMNTISSSGPYIGEDVTVDININAAVALFRIRRVSGSTAGTGLLTITKGGDPANTSVAASTSLCTLAAPCTDIPSVTFAGTPGYLQRPPSVCASGYALTSILTGQTSCMSVAVFPTSVAGWLYDDGAGNRAWTTPTAAQVGALAGNGVTGTGRKLVTSWNNGQLLTLADLAGSDITGVGGLLGNGLTVSSVRRLITSTNNGLVASLADLNSGDITTALGYTPLQGNGVTTSTSSIMTSNNGLVNGYAPHCNGTCTAGKLQKSTGTDGRHTDSIVTETAGLISVAGSVAATGSVGSSAAHVYGTNIDASGNTTGRAAGDCHSDGTNCLNTGKLAGVATNTNSGGAVSSNSSGAWTNVIGDSRSYNAGSTVIISANVSQYPSASINCYARLTFDGGVVGPSTGLIASSTSAGWVTLSPTAAVGGISAGTHTIYLQIASTAGNTCTTDANTSYLLIQVFH